MCSLFSKCKRMSRLAKTERPIQQSLLPNPRDYVPPREISDQLVHLYFRTFESVHRVLHVSSFQHEYLQYWDDSQAASTAFVVKLLLVMAIGSCFFQDLRGPPPHHSSSPQWIYTAQTWINSQTEKSRLNLSAIQIHCLLLIARQIKPVGDEFIWISAGSLIRLAMNMGLHQDSSRSPKMSIYETELRRRLWATVLEISIQSSLDSGMPPLISYNDFDCKPPSNINDEQVEEATRNPPIPRPTEVFTQTSIQIALLRSLPVRLAIVNMLNGLRSEPSYDETLRLGTYLTSACRSNSLLSQSFLNGSSSTGHLRPTVFQIKLLDILTRRFLLSLHLPYAIKAKTSPIYHFSRKVCLESSLGLVSYPPRLQPLDAHTQDDDYTRLIVVCGGFYKSIFVLANTTIGLELLTQLEEDSSPFVSASINSLSRKELHKALEDALDLAARRIEAGETNAKGHVFISCMLGQIDAMLAGRSPEQGIMDAAKKSVELVYGLMRAKMEPDFDQQLRGVGDQLDHVETPGESGAFDFDMLVSLPTTIVCGVDPHHMC